MIILSLDPGVTTGWAVVDTDQRKVVQYGEIRLWRGIEELISKWKPDTVLYEEFKLYPWARKAQTWSEFEPVQVIGVIRYLSELHGVESVKQPASVCKSKSAKRLTPDAARGVGDHIRDAIVHALVLARRRDRKIR